MSDGLGLGGNASGISGQITLNGTPQPIPLPNPFPNSPAPPVNGVAILHVCAPAAQDAFVGTSSTLAVGLGANGGDRIPQGTKWRYFCRQQMYVNGPSGVFTYFYEYS